jgi:tetratricopeptide (TPR) repeat protein
MIIRLHKNLSGKVEELSVGIKASKLSDSNMIVADVLPLLIFIAVFIGSGVFVWQMAKAVQADFYHRQALNVASKRGIDTYNYLVLAEHANPKIALYRTDLAQTNFALANSLALAKGPTEASPAGYLTDDDKLLIQKLLSQSVTEGRVATTLSPRNSQNWVILAGIYRQISGVAQNANDFALDAYGRAIQRDPNNPVLRLNVGGIYYSAKNYELAVRFFNDAANLKQDYANAFYNLSIALKDKGDLQTAYLAGQRVVALLQSDPNNQDYKTASQYLADLKTKIDTAQKENQSNVAGASVTPPAAEQNSALQKENILPNGVDLGQKPKVSTPSAVKNSKSTPAPSANP